MNKNVYCLCSLATILLTLTAAKDSFAIAPLSETSIIVLSKSSDHAGTSRDPDAHEIASRSFYDQALEPIVLYDWEVFETDIFIAWTNVNPGSQTEIYRSTSPDSGFGLITTSTADEEGYVDRNLKPRTHYYYRLRAVDGDQRSEDLEFDTETLSRNYPPTLTGRALDPFTVELTFTDNSYNDINYYVVTKANPNTFGEVVTLSDSGRTVTLQHTNAMPSTTYTYSVDMYAKVRPREGENLEDVASVTVTTPPADQACAGTGSIQREFWYGFTSTDLSAMPVNTTPDKVASHTQFETPNYQGNNYGSRMRGYLCPEVTGNYIFHIASDDQSELYLSADENPANKTKIAYVTGSTQKNQFEKYPTQISVEMTLVRGQRYYIEVLHRDADGADFIQVAWTLPSSERQVPIPGSRLVPFHYTPEPVACTNTGKIGWEVWRNFSGTMETIPVNTEPDYATELTKFETPQYFGNSYASRARGYICPPQTGDYVFYLSSDDKSKLFLSTDATPANKTKIAEVTGYTKYNEWNKYPSQQSATIRLQQGQKYYVEVLHQEVNGNDFIAVGWKLPDGVLQRPIPGGNLMPFSGSANQNPSVSVISPENGSTFSAPASVTIIADANDADGSVVNVSFYNGTSKLGEDTTSPYQFTWNNVPSGSYTITAKATDNAGGTASASASFTVSEPCSGAGSIYREVWFNAAGSTVSSIPLSREPNYWHYITTLETPQYWENNYGSRIRGYLCVPTTGSYTFFISSDDQSELWLSTDDNPANKTRVAAVPGYSPFRNFSKYSEQQSAATNLVGGRRYYIEVLHKEANGNDHVTVAWQLPDGAVESPIAGNRLIPWGYEPTAATQFTDAAIVPGMGDEADISLYPNPAATRSVTLGISNASGLNQAKIQVVSANGTIVFDELVDCGGDCAEVPLTLKESVKAGLYMVNVYRGRQRWSKKLIIE